MNINKFTTINEYFDYIIFNLQGNITDFYFQALNQHVYVNFFEMKKILIDNQLNDFYNKACLNCLHKNSCVFLSALLEMKLQVKSNQKNELNNYLDILIQNKAITHAKSFCRYYESNKTSKAETINKLNKFHNEIFKKNHNI